MMRDGRFFLVTALVAICLMVWYWQSWPSAPSAEEAFGQIDRAGPTSSIGTDRSVVENEAAPDDNVGLQSARRGSGVRYQEARVSRESGQPAADIPIRVGMRGDGVKEQSAIYQTDSHGRFTHPVQIGEVDLHYELGDREGLLVPGGWQRYEEESLRELVVVGRGIRISGHVHEDGAPRPLVTVTASGRWSGVSDQDGFYSFEAGIAEDHIVLSCKAIGSVLERREIHATDDELFQNWELRAGATLKGRIVSGDGGAIAGVDVTVVGTGLRTSTDTEGRFRIDGLETGEEVLVTCFANDYEPMAEKVQVVRDVERVWTLLSASGPWCRVLGPGGEGIAGADIWVMRRGLPRMAQAIAVTDAQGVARLPTYLNGRWEVEAESRGMVGRAAVMEAGVEVRLSAKSSATVYVIDMDGQGVTAASVRCSGDVRMTDSAGRCRITGTPRSRIIVAKSGYGLGQAKFRSEGAIDITIGRLEQLHVRVVDGQRQPIRCFTLKCREGAANPAWNDGVTCVSEDGEARLYVLESARGTAIEVSANGWRPWRGVCDSTDLVVQMKKM